MLTRLELANFKSWRDTGRIELAPVTAFFGANSSGKTSILQSLLMLRQTVENPDRNQTLALSGLADLGTYQDIIYGHREESPLRLFLKWQSEEPVEVFNIIERARKKSSVVEVSNELSLNAEIDIRSTQANVREMTYAVGDTTFSMIRKADNEYELMSNRYEFKRTQGRAWPLPHPNKFYSFPDQVRLYYQNASFLSEIEFGFETACRNIRYLGPLREDPRREYIFSGGAPRDVGTRGELSINALIASRISERKISRGWTGPNHNRRLRRIPIEQVIAQWLSELGLISSFELESLDDRGTLYRVSVRQRPRSTPVLLTDVGFGVSQVLPVLVLLAYAQSGDTLILEQPEIHLHPAVQSGLADIILETALTRNIQVILESHSEHLLTRLQRRIAESHFGHHLRVKSTDVALYFCKQVEGESTLDQLEVDLFGNIANWPEEFFGDPLADRIAMLEAERRRKAGSNA
ncbi:DUF3696 domain-containing protein [Mycolicibacterium helvum]|uniref:DUF3696 domain-containing protein n=1 Tax=Mycolicibacterium helvum TaxID=1534349 RepID=A0A7I7TGE0_9MYCO|nr:DUF3696 domain-containing protein [Mycolicibacterium helvum]BBY67773.1 hypothetical protein MHEL_60160 [Mycolicibacterium helvum]